MVTAIVVPDNQPDQYTVVSLGGTWTRDAKPSELSVLLQLRKDDADTVRGSFSMGEGGVVPLPEDTETIGEGEETRDETPNETRRRLFLAFHANVENRTMTDKVLTDLEARLSLALIKGLWKSLS